MYSELIILMSKNKVSIIDISKELNLRRETISNKIKGKSKFTIEEITKIRDKFFPEISLDKLCTKV